MDARKKKLYETYDRLTIEIAFENGSQIEQCPVHSNSEYSWIDFDSDNPEFDWDRWKYRIKKDEPFDSSDALFLTDKKFRRLDSPDEIMLCTGAGKEGVMLKGMFFLYRELKEKCEIWSDSAQRFESCIKKKQT